MTFSFLAFYTWHEQERRVCRDKKSSVVSKNTLPPWTQLGKEYSMRSNLQNKKFSSLFRLQHVTSLPLLINSRKSLFNNSTGDVI